MEVANKVKTDYLSESIKAGNFGGLSALADKPIWWTWKVMALKDGRIGKVPVPVRYRGVDNDLLSSKDWNKPEVSDLVTGPEALAFYKKHRRKLSGLGIAPRPGSGVVIVDCDSAFDAERRAPADWTDEIVWAGADGYMEAHVEASPSGKGLRIVGLGGGACVSRKLDVPGADPAKVPGLEIFADTNEHWATITGFELQGSRPAAPIPATLMAAHALIAAKGRTTATKSAPADDVGEGEKARRSDELSDFARGRYTPEHIESALMAIPTAEFSNRDAWRNIAGAIKEFFVDDADHGAELFHVWSARDESCYDEDAATKLYDSLNRRTGQTRVTPMFLIKEAKKHGWADPNGARDDGEAFGAPELDQAPIATSPAKSAKAALSAYAGGQQEDLANAVAALQGREEGEGVKAALDALASAAAPADGIVDDRELDAAMTTALPYLENIAAGAPAVVREITAYKFRPFDQIPRVRWLYGHHLIRGYVSATIAPGGTGKSALALVDAVAICTGRDLIGQRPVGLGRVWFWSEDPREEIEARIAALLTHYRIDPREIEGRLFFDSARKFPIVIAKQESGAVKVNWKGIAEIKAFVRRNKIDAVIIDPLAASHLVNENDNGAMNAVANAWTSIADECDCAVDLIHHTRKRSAGNVSNETVADDARGASSLLSAARSARVLSRMSADEGVKLGVAQHSRYLKVNWTAKANLAPAADGVSWYELASGEVGNGDRKGVIIPWTPPARAGLSREDMAKVLAVVARAPAGDEHREAPQTKRWIGLAVIEGLALGDRSDLAVRSRAAKVASDMLACGALVRVRGKDGKARDVEVIVAGELPPADDGDGFDMADVD